MEKEKRKRTALDLCDIALSVALLTVCAWISFRVGECNYTLQLLAVFVCSGLFGVKRALVAVTSYIVMGLVGIPVFAGGVAGPSPTSGFVIGFFAVAALAGLCPRCKPKRLALRFLARGGLLAAGTIALYAFGTVWIMAWADVSLAFALLYCVLPYLWFDAVKIVLALLLIERLEPYIR